VTFNGTEAQAINGTATSQTFNNVTVAMTAGQTLSVSGSTTSLTVNNLTETTGNFTPPATLNITGDFTHTAGTFTAGTGTVLFNGSVAQNLGGATATTFNNLTINSSAGVTLGASPTVNATFTLTLGDITTGANQVIIIAARSVATPSVNSYVNGTLAKTFANGAGQYFTFPIGDAANYTPVSLSGFAVTTGGTVAAKVNAGDDPNLASGIDTSRSVNHYWTLTPTTIVIRGTTATFGFTGIPTDVDALADTSSFIIRRFSAAAWTPTTAGTRTPTSTAASGIAGFGEFAIGNPSVGAPSDIGTGSSTTPGTTLAVSLSGGVAVGDTVIVSFAMDPVSGTVSATDTQGNTYTDDSDNMQGVSGSGTGVRMVVLSAHVTTPLLSGNAITITHPSVTSRAASACYASGLLSASRVDQMATGGSSTVAATTGATGSATTLYADELLIGAVGIENLSTAFTPGASYAPLSPVAASTGVAGTSIAILPEYRIVGAAGAYTAGGSGWASSFWAANMVTCRTAEVSTPVAIGTATSTASGTTITVSVPAAGVAVNNTVIVSIAMDPSAASVGVTDARGNTYTADEDVTNGTGTMGVRTLVFSARVTTALQRADLITVTFGSAVVGKAVSAAYFNGLVAASRVDQTTAATGASITPSSGNTATTLQPDELVYGAIGAEETTTTATTLTVGRGIPRWPVPAPPAQQASAFCLST
jgi:hypothetical protein